MTFSRNTFPISFSVLFLTRRRIPHLLICILFFPSYSLRVLQFISDFFVLSINTFLFLSNNKR
ncbi:hypothetical protein NC651_036954 [Populus alba x Populus x berolinensis]|nr:hypothetical protein NC651_036954 [Populus alba x Populus x berolinensis]